MKANIFSRRCFAGLILCVCVQATGAEDPKALRILFVGNSYTAQSWGAITDVFTDHHVERHVKGGATLEGWVQDKDLASKIESGNWDYVVLQEQSQRPSLSKEQVSRFHQASAALAARVKAGGGKTVLFMTWGRREGDARNKQINPTFEAMQKRLSASYREAASRLDAKLAPVGEVFAVVKKQHPDLFPLLYKKDGSHPAGSGGYAAAYSMHAVIVGVVPTEHAKKKGGDLPKIADAVKQATSK